jgi:hypothetical protein
MKLEKRREKQERSGRPSYVVMGPYSRQSCASCPKWRYLRHRWVAVLPVHPTGTFAKLPISSWVAVAGSPTLGTIDLDRNREVGIKWYEMVISHTLQMINLASWLQKASAVGS